MASSPDPPPTSVSRPPPPRSPPPPPPRLRPPPPPRSQHQPPPPPRASRNSTEESPPPPPSGTAIMGQTVNVPLVVGVTAGLGLFFIMLLVAYICSLKKRKMHVDAHYYSDPSRGGSRSKKAGDYYAGGPPTWNTGLPTVDSNPKLAGPPGLVAPWNALPPPPPINTSGDMSTSAFSGPHGPPLPPPSPTIALGFNKSTFTYDELALATNGFSQANLLGQGGFGYVHKGVLPNGKEIAVKSLKSGSGQGEREFQAEVDIISRVHHRHLVSLVGYCIAGGQRMLVYEFVPNNTLEFHLQAITNHDLDDPDDRSLYCVKGWPHGRDRPVMDFQTRLKIALGSAKGLAYLHEDCHPRIIHRDIKAANILLDYKFEAMVADFGLAKLSSDNFTHVSTRVMGTFGYLAPEYASSGKLTEKSDVFSFGIMLLELITGRRPVDSSRSSIMEDSLVDWARPLLTKALSEGGYEELVDPRLGNNYNHNEMTRLVACAAAGTRHSGRRRPKMSQIVRALEGDSSLEDLNDGVKPGYSAAFGSTGSSDYDSAGSYKNQMRRFHKMALASEDFGSSEFGVTSEYGLDPSPSSSEANSREIKQPSYARRPLN